QAFDRSEELRAVGSATHGVGERFDEPCRVWAMDTHPEECRPEERLACDLLGRAKLVLELLGAQLRRPEDKSLLPSSAHGHLAHGGRGCEEGIVHHESRWYPAPTLPRPRRRRAATIGPCPARASCPASSRPLRVST